MKFTPAALAVCILLSGATPLFLRGVDLMALKKQEEERRKKIAKSKVAVTDSNVNSISVGNKKYGFVQMESDVPPQEAEGAVTPAAGKKRDLTQEPEFWKKQQAELQERLAKLKDEIERGQIDLNKLWSDFYIASMASRQQAIRGQIGALTGQIEQKKLSLGQIEAQLAELSEKARKAGVPPGWLR